MLARGERGTLSSFPKRTGFPPQRRPLVVMTYNIAGHDELLDGDHVRHIAEAIRRLRPDIVALQEVHRGTWQARFRDQLAELESRTGLHGYFAPSYVLWGGGYGNAILTRGRIVQGQVHPLPCLGEPRALLEATVLRREMGPNGLPIFRSSPGPGNLTLVFAADDLAST